MKILLTIGTAAMALSLYVASAQAQYQGSDEATSYAQSWGAASGYNGGVYARSGRHYRYSR